MDNMFSKEYSKIADLCRGIAAFLVIMGHCFLLAENQYGVASWAIDVIYSFHMPLFMLICGYFSYKSYKNMEREHFCVGESPHLFLRCQYGLCCKRCGEL